VCLEIGHIANNYWHRFEEEYVPKPRSVAMVSGPDANSAWYTNLGDTDHITGELDRLTMHESYSGTYQIQAANGSGMDITQIGTSIVPTSS
jgi:hypothetical protein